MSDSAEPDVTALKLKEHLKKKKQLEKEKAKLSKKFQSVKSKSQ
jgi:hypothetical protein